MSRAKNSQIIVSGSTSNSAIATTLLEFQTLITNSQLVPNATYRVNGLDDNFCDGFFTAISTNQFNSNGYGLFKNPNYNLYSLWTNQFYSGVTITTGTPLLNDVFTNGVESLIWKTQGVYITNQDSLPNGVYTSGAKEVTVLNANVTPYTIDDIVIFGNKHWKNITGNLGAKVDELHLNADWEQVFTNLISVVDEIEYDIINDWIESRKDNKGNEISLTYADEGDEFGDEFNYVKTFNWGKADNNNKISKWFGVFCNLGFQSANNTVNYFFAYNNTGSNFHVYNNIGSSFNLYENTGNSFALSNNTGNNFDFKHNTGNNFIFRSNTGFNFSLYMNMGNYFEIENNIGNDFNLNNNIGNSFLLKNNTGRKFNLQGKNLDGKNIIFCDFKDIAITVDIDISLSTHLFANYGKSIFRNSADVMVVSYVDASNVQVIALITS